MAQIRLFSLSSAAVLCSGNRLRSIAVRINIGRRSPAFPVTPPYVRVRIRRFGGLSYRPPVNLGIPSESNLQPVPLMDMGFAVLCPLARHRMPQIRFLYIGSCVCFTLLSDPPSPERPCASLLLHLHQVVEGTYTPELSNMLGTQKKPPACAGGSCSCSRVLLTGWPGGWLRHLGRCKGRCPGRHRWRPA